MELGIIEWDAQCQIQDPALWFYHHRHLCYPWVALMFQFLWLHETCSLGLFLPLLPLWDRDKQDKQSLKLQSVSLKKIIPFRTSANIMLHLITSLFLITTSMFCPSSVLANILNIFHCSILKHRMVFSRRRTEHISHWYWLLNRKKNVRKHWRLKRSFITFYCSCSAVLHHFIQQLSLSFRILQNILVSVLESMSVNNFRRAET